MPRRVDRVNELLRQEISRLLTLQTKDPRLRGVITVTRVISARDLRGAQVFISVMGDSAEKQSALEGIRSAAAFLRRELRPRLNLRYIPFLTFALDDSLEEADHILGIMDHIRDNQLDIPGLPDTPGMSEGDAYVGPLTSPGSDG
jgi:ribosome-binding factor A